MTTERIQLQPGVFLNLVQTDRFKTGCFSYNLLHPIRKADAAPNALLPSILLRGCRDYPDIRAISNRLDMLYGAGIGTLIRKKGEVQSVGIYADFLEDRYTGGEEVFSPMMTLLKSLLLDPCLTENGLLDDYVSGEKQNLIHTIEAEINDKRTYAVSRMLKQMCKGETYAIPRLGEIPTLKGVDGRLLYARWLELLRTSRIELFYLGQQPKEKVLEAVSDLVEQLPVSERVNLPGIQTGKPRKTPRYIQEIRDVSQGKLVLGLRTDICVLDAAYPALLLLNAIYGSGMTSKLFMKIREEQSLCYYADSSVDKYKGIMLVEAGIEPGRYDQALDGILKQLDHCKAGRITSEELEEARRGLLSILRTGCDSPGRLDDYAIGQSVAGMSGQMEDLAMQLEMVTLDQVVEAASSLCVDTVYFLKGVEA